MDIKTTGATHKIGQERYKYLDLANISYANAQNLLDYRRANGFMDAFEFTLEPGSEAKKELMRKKETVDQERKEAVRKWEQWKEGLGFWEQEDAETERMRLEIEAVGKRLDACWEISKRYGLFND
jgi:hypothetical protein